MASSLDLVARSYDYIEQFRQLLHLLLEALLLKSKRETNQQNEIRQDIIG